MIIEYSWKDLAPKYILPEKFHLKFIISPVLKVQQHVSEERPDLRAYIHLNECRRTQLNHYKIIFRVAVGEDSAALI